MFFPAKEKKISKSYFCYETMQNLRKPISIMFKIKFTSSYLVISRKLSRNYEKRSRNYEKRSRTYEKIKS